jgi:hypothetical protein
MVLKYYDGMHRYIQVEMEFLDISSLVTAYRYVVKIEQKLKQKTCKFWAWEPLIAKSRKGWSQPVEKRADQRWTTSKRKRKIPGSGVTSIRAPGITLLIATQSSLWWLR